MNSTSDSDLDSFITRMPKVELHVHLEGSVRPQTLLKLAARHAIALPADDLASLRAWYAFRDFDHFLSVYKTIAGCLRTADDIELIAREFLAGQAEQHILYSEVTFTPYLIYAACGLGFHEQIDAFNRARVWAESTLGVRAGAIVDIPRSFAPEDGDTLVEWAISRHGDGVVALGLGGAEVGNPPEKFQRAWDRAADAGLPCILHAGEVVGPSSIWSALRAGRSRRIGHGVRAVEDPELMVYLRECQIPLEVCPTSNVCLKVFPSLEEHCLPRLMAEGLYITINSDDPPMFDTTLTNEYLQGHRVWGWDRAMIERIVLNAVDAALLPDAERLAMHITFQNSFRQIA